MRKSNLFRSRPHDGAKMRDRREKLLLVSTSVLFSVLLVSEFVIWITHY